MRVNLMDLPPPVTVMGKSVPRDDIPRIIRYSAPALALIAVVVVVSIVRLIGPFMAANAAQHDLAVETRAVRYDPARKTLLQSESQRLSDVRSALDAQRGGFARVVGPVVDVANAKPSTSRLTRVTLNGSTADIETESRDYNAVADAQRALQTAGHPATIKTTAFGNDTVTWTATVGVKP